MIGLEIGKVRIHEYDASWPQAFLTERKDLEEALGPLATRPKIEHVGSTAVPQLAAKPIIDVLIGFRDLTDLGQGLALLVASGHDYVKAANQPGMLFMAKGDPGQRAFHYHLVVYGTPAWRKLVVFRDYLRRHPGAAREYGTLKVRLAKEFPDSRTAYTGQKRPALRTIMQRGFAEDDRRRNAKAVLLTLAMDEEESALRKWWDAGRGRAPWSVDTDRAGRVFDTTFEEDVDHRPDDHAELEALDPNADA